jgi:hypothetical protein
VYVYALAGAAREIEVGFLTRMREEMAHLHWLISGNPSMKFPRTD